MNDTQGLEALVAILEETVVDLEDDVKDVESSLNLLQEQRLNTIEVELLDSDNDIEYRYKTTIVACHVNQENSVQVYAYKVMVNSAWNLSF